MRNIPLIICLTLVLSVAGSLTFAQYYYPEYPETNSEYYRNSYGAQQPYGNPYTDQRDPRSQPPEAYGYGPFRSQAQQGYQEHPSTRNQGYRERHGERILREQMARAMTPPTPGENHYGHRLTGQNQMEMVMAEADYISSILSKKNGKAFIVIDKRNFQFYLYNRSGKLLRIGPVAIGKGRTNVGAFETPIGIFPIRAKIPVDDWVRPDWYFIEEGEPIPRNYEDRRVPGFFRYKLVIEGTRYIHYAEATGGRLTHGCLGLDWEDAEAVFHTLDVGSYCIVIDHPFLQRLARGEFPIKTAPKPKKKEELETRVVAAQKPDAVETKQNKTDEATEETITARVQQPPEKRSAPFTNMW